ncbi:amino acid adenylation domain-containing protein [Roseivirga sp. BDSF3-8]|uniref:amino acid adenylation domain-containing protein n=1 Tax=Roseivirga sp. BDSF3-8 TaxID=3241598 RepID=UPI003531D6FD
MHQIENTYPLTPLQEGMFYHYLKSSESNTYITQIDYELKGAVDSELVRRAFDTIVERHDILRTSFLNEGLNNLTQVVWKERTCPFDTMDLSGNENAAKQEEILKQVKSGQYEQAFDLEKEPLMRLNLIRLDKDTWRMVWTYHHIILDGWSCGILHQEFFHCYYAYYQGTEEALPPAPQFSKYLKYLEGTNKKEGTAYWKKYLEGYNTIASLPGKHVLTTEGVAYDNEDIYLELGKDLSDSLKHLARERRTTLNTILQAAWGLLLAEYNESEDVVFGTVVSGRPAGLHGAESIAGLFINTIPVRLSFDSGQNFWDLVAAHHTRALKAEPYHHIALADIQANSIPGHDLVNHIFVFENAPLDKSSEEKSGDAPFTIRQVDGYAETNYDFNVNILPADRILFRFDFNRNVFHRHSLEDFIAHYHQVLRRIATGESFTLASLTALSEEQKSELLKLGTGPEADYGKGRTLSQVLQEVTARQSDKPAVRCGEETLSYGELDQKATLLARHMQAKGVQAGEVVAVMAYPSQLSIIALSAIIKTGAIYLPVDTYLPKERVIHMITDAGARLILTEMMMLADALELTGYADMLMLDDIEEVKDAALSEVVISPHDIAYIIYTSGTTGTPKGVQIKQESIIDRAMDHIAYLPVSEDDTVLQLASHSFDASLMEVFMALMSGATLEMAPHDIRKNVPALIDLIDSRKVSVCIMPPAIIRLLERSPLPGLRVIISTGEAATLEDSLYYARSKRVLNGYGPTETCVGASFGEVHADKAEAYRHVKAIPIGKPFANTTIYLLGKGDKLVPKGMTGEICVGGIGLAEGYLNHPELTAEKFIPSPFGEGCLYRTGDLGRWNGQGELEYLGRIDEQVQINGIRVELAEIENLLMKQDGIISVAVKVQENEKGEKALIAYYTARESLSLLGIREYLGAHLPHFMLPAYAMQMDELPLTSNNKTDKKKLPEIDPALFHDTEAYRAPETETESKMAEIWETILEKEMLGIDDHFFHVGGHSLKGIQIISRIYKVFDRRISLADLFAHPTIAGLSAYLDGQEHTTYQAIAPLPARDHYPLSFAQLRLWLLGQRSETGGAYNVPAAYELVGDVETDKLESSLAAVINRHEILRTVFVEVQGEPVQKILPDAASTGWRLHVVDLSDNDQAEEILEDLAAENFSAPFDLSSGPLLRTTLVHMAPGRHVLLFTIHHIASDGWSAGLLFRDFSQYYNAAVSNVAPGLVRLTVHYKEFADWQRRQLLEENAAPHRAYWLQKLENPPLTVVAGDKERPRVKSYTGQTIAHPFDQEVYKGLKTLAEDAGVSKFVLLTALIKTLITRMTGRTDHVVGTVINARGHEDFEHQVGMFTNTLALRTRVGSEATFADMLQQVRQTVVEAFKHQKYPFEQVLDDLRYQTPEGHAPLFDIMVVHQDENRQKSSRLKGVELKPYKLDVPMSRYDLIFAFRENEEGLTLGVEFSEDLYKESFIYAMLARLDLIIDQILFDKNQPLNSIRIDLEEEREVVASANAIDLDFDFD